jgi:hypothetical protein
MPVVAALRQLPHVGEDRSGPPGPGLLSSGSLGAIVRQLQAGVVAIGSDAACGETPLNLRAWLVFVR